MASTIGRGLRTRLSRIEGDTPKGVLTKPQYLPATLRGFEWSEEFAHEEYSTPRAGQFSQESMGPASARQLRQVGDTETMALTWDAAWLIDRGISPEHLRDQLNLAGRARKPVLLVVAHRGGAQVLRMAITIRSITHQIREGEPDTVYYTLRFTEWRRRATGRKGQGSGSGGSGKLPTTVKIDSNDSLYSLSKRFYKSAAGTDDIARANGIKGFGKKTPLVKSRKFKVGSKLKIPDIGPIATIGAPD